MPRIAQPPIQLFSTKYSVLSNGCWQWHGAKNKGYGVFGHPTSSAHRFSYRFYKGDIADGMHIDHLCRNTSCVNPDHLEVVTPAVNAQRRTVTKLNKGVVNTIKRMYGDGKSQSSIGKYFGVSQSQVSRVIAGQRWETV